MQYPKECQRCLQELKKEKCGEECVTYKFALILKKERELEARPLDNNLLTSLQVHTILK